MNYFTLNKTVKELKEITRKYNIMAIGINLGDDCSCDEFEEYIPINDRIKYLNPKAKNLINLVDIVESLCPGFYKVLIELIESQFLKND